MKIDDLSTKKTLPEILGQGLTINLKRVYVSTYALKNLGVSHIQGKSCKKLKKHKGSKSTSKTNGEKPF